MASFAHRHSIVEAEGEFRDFKELVPEARKVWVDRVWTYYMRRQDLVNAFCGCYTCNEMIEKYYGRGRTIEDVRSISKKALDRCKAIVFTHLLDTSIDDEEVDRRCSSVTKAEPMSDVRMFLTALMQIESSVHADERDIDLLVRPRR